MLWLLVSGKLVALLLAIGAGWLLYDALRSPRYRVRVVEAAGTQALSEAEVAALAAVQNQPIWYIEPSDVAARVSQSPYVERAVARLILPDRLRVTVSERKPDVRWLHDGRVYAVTWAGLVLDQVVDQPPATAPVSSTTMLSRTGSLSSTQPLTTTTAPVARSVPANIVTIVDTTPNRPLKQGDQVDPDALELARRVTLRAPSELPAPITRIEWDGGLGVSLIFDGNRQAVLGKSAGLDRKLATLRVMLNDNTAWKYLDLRPNAPYYK